MVDQSIPGRSGSPAPAAWTEADPSLTKPAPPAEEVETTYAGGVSLAAVLGSTMLSVSLSAWPAPAESATSAGTEAARLEGGRSRDDVEYA